MFKKVFSIVLALTLVASVWLVPVSAVDGYGGYAVYRDGVELLGVDFWHAAIMQRPSTDYSMPVIHHPGKNTDYPYVKRDTWESFMDGQNFQGVYRHPNKSAFNYAKDYIVDLARCLAAENIEYTLFHQVDYNTPLGDWVLPEDITKMRCDGVVEYCYEYHGLRVYGPEKTWDITLSNEINHDVHSGIMITPKNQAQNYLTRVSLSKPTGYK